MHLCPCACALLCLFCASFVPSVPVGFRPSLQPPSVCDPQGVVFRGRAVGHRMRCVPFVAKGLSKLRVAIVSCHCHTTRRHWFIQVTLESLVVQEAMGKAQTRQAQYRLRRLALPQLKDAVIRVRPLRRSQEGQVPCGHVTCQFSGVACCLWPCPCWARCD